ncbi:MAG: zinc-dependent peptidase, partial [Phycisphaerales bacterium]|nr:zinc-dependent peptidase [Phycisphaerales bacterium]
MSLLRKHHRRTLLATPFPEAWQDILDADVPYTQLLDERELVHLRETIAILVDEKYWEGCGEL